MKLDELIAEFSDLEPAEKLEWLVEFADQLPDLSPGRAGAPFPDTCLVRECQTPVYLWVDLSEGRIQLEADVPRKSPTVRGLVALLVVGLNGATIAAAGNLPDDLVATLGLTGVLGMTRQQGFRGVVARLKAAVRNGTGDDAAPS
jgi:cysteine desulfuration protein SufE